MIDRHVLISMRSTRWFTGFVQMTIVGDYAFSATPFRCEASGARARGGGAEVRFRGSSVGQALGPGACSGGQIGLMIRSRMEDK